MQENLESTLASLVAIPSVSHDPFACNTIMNFVHDELRTYNLIIEAHLDNTHPWLLATTRNTKTPDILFYCHLDVVPGSSDMFQMQKQDGRIIGRGVYDMKLAAACYLEFLRSHAASLSDLNIGFVFTADEETDSGCMNDVIASGLRPKIVFIPDGGDNWQIERRAKGFHASELVVTGKTAHGSRPWEGDNALHALLDIIQPLREAYPRQETERPTLMVNSIQSGQVVNQLPDLAIAKLDFRCFNQYEMNEYKALLDDILKRHSNLTMHVRNSGEPVKFNDDSPYVQGFLRAYEKVRGTSASFTDSYGGADSRFFTQLGIPCIVVEPYGGGRHSEHEWLEASDLINYYVLIKTWILDEAKVMGNSSYHKSVSRVADTAGELV